MKVIAKVNDDRFIVEATADELAQCAGYHGAYYIDLWRGQNRGPRIGEQIMVTKTHRYLGDLRGKEEEVRKAETLLRALADMLHSALPTTIVPPETESVEEPK